MALTLGVNKRSKFYVDDTEVVVLRTDGFQSITVQVQSKPPQDFFITDMESTEILPTVFVSCGLPTSRSDGHLPRLVFEAPREVIILREELYLKKNAN